MKRQLLVKAMVLGAVACSISATSLAAHVEGQDKRVNGQVAARREAVRSHWMDRTDIVVGTGMERTEGSSSQGYTGRGVPNAPQPSTSSEKSQSMGMDQFYIETLQPITHYDEHAKNLVFVQGRIGRSGEKISLDKLHDYWVPAMPAGTFTVHNHETYKQESLGMNANVGLGYRHLSEHEHAYVGVNAFYDHAFKGGYKRISGGLEYVAGLNEFHANIYQNIGANNKQYVSLPGRSTAMRDPAGLYPYGMDQNQTYYNYGVISYENHWKVTEQVAARGFDLGYARSFKNARWARVYADYYKWRGRDAERIMYGNLSKRDAITGFKVGAEFHLTPHLTLDAGYKTASHNLSGPYVSLKYTIGRSKFAWRGGKHSESVITTARAKMLDKVRRSDMVVHNIVQEDYDRGIVDVGL